MCVPLAGSASSCCGISWLALSHMSTVVILRVQFQVPLVRILLHMSELFVTLRHDPVL